jgi:hypothetical protein
MGSQGNASSMRRLPRKRRGSGICTRYSSTERPLSQRDAPVARAEKNRDSCCDEGDDLENHCPLILVLLQAGGLACGPRSAVSRDGKLSKDRTIAR